MRLIVSDIPEDGLERELELPIKLTDSEKTDSAHVRLRVMRFKRKVLIDGSFNISVSQQCSRCLKDFSYPLDITFREEYNPAEEIGKEGEQELTSQDMDLGFYNDDEIDVNDLIKEQVMLALPIKALCSTDCRGICVRCGKDNNIEQCNCETKEADPRMAPLQKLKEILKEKGKE